MAAEEATVTSREWLALFGVMLGAFMAVLDIQITNSSLKDIAGAIGSSIDEGSWISTAYLVAEIIVIGVSGIMAAIFSVKTLPAGDARSASSSFRFSAHFAATLLGIDHVPRRCRGMTGRRADSAGFQHRFSSCCQNRSSPSASRSSAMTATFGPSIGPTIGGHG